MASLNKIMLIGNLTRDPEIKRTPKGTAVAEIGLAVNRNYLTEGGEKREEVTFVDVTLWGRVAEIVGEYCKKGRPLFVEGRLQLDTWDDKDSGQAAGGGREHPAPGRPGEGRGISGAVARESLDHLSKTRLHREDHRCNQSRRIK